MRTIHDYMMLARERHGYTSRRQLSNALGLSASTVHFWDQQRTWPNDEDMIGLADSAGVDRLEALNDRDTWRAAGLAKSCYQKIGELLARGAATTLILLAVTATAWGGTGRAQGNVCVHYTGYYGKSMYLLLFQQLTCRFHGGMSASRSRARRPNTASAASNSPRARFRRHAVRRPAPPPRAATRQGHGSPGARTALRQDGPTPYTTPRPLIRLQRARKTDA